MNGLTSHKQIVRHDIKLSAKIVHNLDNRVGLWNEEKKDESVKQEDDKENKTAESNHEVEQAVSKNCILLIMNINTKHDQTVTNCACHFRLLDCRLKIQY